jgi:hypothetical protein
MIRSETSLLLGLIPPSEIEPRQIAVTKNGDELPTYKFLREPSTINELAQFKKGIVVYMENNTLVLINFQTSIQMTLSGPQVQYTKYFFMDFVFTYNSRTNCQIFGDSPDDILETAVFLANLKILGERKMIDTTLRFHDALIFDDCHFPKLAQLFDVMAGHSMTFLHSRFNHVLSRVIATRPHPLDVSLLISTVDHDVFFEHLQARSTIFGSLSLGGFMDDDGSFRRQLFSHLHLFDKLHAGDMPKDLILTLLSAPLERISFTVTNQETEDLDVSSADIVPKDILLLVQASDDLFPVQFVSSFFDRVGQLGHVEKLAFGLLDPCLIPADVGRALCQAVVTSQNLTRLQLLCKKNFDPYLRDLFAVLETHVGLRTLGISGYHECEIDFQVPYLKRLLKQNRNIEVFGIPNKLLEADPEIMEICSINRFFRGSQSVMGESPLSRLALLGAALIHNGKGNFQRAGILLNDHVDMLLEMIQDADSIHHV